MKIWKETEGRGKKKKKTLIVGCELEKSAGADFKARDCCKAFFFFNIVFEFGS